MPGQPGNAVLVTMVGIALLQVNELLRKKKKERTLKAKFQAEKTPIMPLEVHSQAILMYAFWLFWVPVVLQATH